MRYCAILFISFVFSGCNQAVIDRNIKAEITARAKDTRIFAGIRYYVLDGEVMLSGQSTSSADRRKVEATIKRMAGVKNVKNEITVAPVLMDTDYELKIKADSVLAQYPSVYALVADSTILLRGIITPGEKAEMRQVIEQLQARLVIDSTAYGLR